MLLASHSESDKVLHSCEKLFKAEGGIAVLAFKVKHLNEEVEEGRNKIST